MPREHFASNTHDDGQGTLTGEELMHYAYEKLLVKAHNPPAEEGQD